MAALRPSEVHPAPPPQAQRSFLDALSGISSEPFNPKTPRTFRGKPHVHFDAADIDRYSKPFNHALIGKFLNGRPSMERIRKSFIAIGFSGQYSIGLIDYRHLIIRFNLEEDYIRCFLKRKWSIDGFAMRVLKWHYKFSVDTECSIAHVWVKFPLLPLHLYNKEALFSIARLVGEPLKLDASTLSFNRPSVARVCVEVDLLKELVTEVWITQMEFGFWQTVEYDDLPSFCSSCLKIGHVSDVCRRNSATTSVAQSSKIEAPMPAAPSRLQWQIKASNQAPPPALVRSAAADPNPEHHEHADLSSVNAPLSVQQANLGANVASTSHAPVLVQSAPFPPIAQQKQGTLALAAATVAACSVPAIVCSATAETNPSVQQAIGRNVASTSHAPVFVQSFLPIAQQNQGTLALVASSVTECSVPLRADFSGSTEECTPLHSNFPTLVAAPESLPSTSNATNLPTAATLHLHSHAQQPKLPASSSASSSLTKEAPKSFVDILLGAQQPEMVSSISFKPRFHEIKSAEFPSLPLPIFRIFFAARPLFPQDSLEEPDSPRPADLYQMYSEGDDVPRPPIQRKNLSFFLRASYQDFQAKFKKGRRPVYISVNRKKWKKLPPFSSIVPASTSNTSTNKAPDSHECQMANPHVEDPGDDSPVEYESNWHSSTSDDEADTNSENLLGFEEEYLPLDYHDFSFALPLQTRRKYNKRFRDLPPPTSYPQLKASLIFVLFHLLAFWLKGFCPLCTLFCLSFYSNKIALLWALLKKKKNTFVLNL